MLAKISLGISILLCIICGLLAYKVFSGPSAPKAEDLSPAPTASAFASGDSVRAPVIAYVNGDSIMAHYDAFKEMEASIKDSYRASSGKVEQEIKKAQDEYEQLMSYAQQQGDKLPEADAKAMQERLMQLEYQIQNLKSEEENKLIKKETELNNELMKTIREYLTRYGTAHNIDMVMNYMEVQQNLLYANGAFDITGSVVEGLNAEYALKKQEGK